MNYFAKSLKGCHKNVIEEPSDPHKLLFFLLKLEKQYKRLLSGNTRED
jgi:hypothetical protein